MAGAFITTTSRTELRPLASQGIFVTDCFHQVHALLQSISPQHVALLAEPVHSEGGGGRESVDWYAHESLGHGTALSVASLPQEQRHAALQRVHTLAQDVSAKADSLIQSGDNQHILSGEILKFALQHPGENDIWLMNGHPVVVNWGFAPGTVGAKPEDLTRLGYVPVAAATPAAAAAASPIAAAPSATTAAAATTVAPAAATVAASRGGCLPFLGWLLPLFLLLLLLLLLLGALGLFHIPFPTGCVPTLPKIDLSEEVEEEKAKGDDLFAELEALRRQLEEKAALCIPPKAEIPPQEPTKPQEPEIVPPVEEPVTEPPFFGQEEPLPEKPLLEEPPLEESQEEPLTEPFLAMTPEEEPEPEPEPRQEPQREPKQEPKPERKQEPKPQKDDPLRIPENASEENDLSFLEGCWRSVTDLFNSRTGKPVVAEYCFDKKGQGRQIIREHDGTVCTGGVEAEFGRGGSLVMESFPARCPDGNSYVPETVQCTGSDNSTNCKGTSTNNGRRNQWNARFYRK